MFGYKNWKQYSENEDSQENLSEHHYYNNQSWQSYQVQNELSQDQNYFPQTYDDQNKEVGSFTQSKMSQCDPSQQPVDVSTKYICGRVKKKNQRNEKAISKNQPIVGEKCQKKKQQQTSETKNLPKYFINCFLNRLEKQEEIMPSQNIQIRKKINKFSNKSCSLKTLQEMLKDNFINEIAQEYICSFDFLHHILKSERLQDVLPPIKYSNKLYQGCFNSNALNQWKES